MQNCRPTSKFSLLLIDDMYRWSAIILFLLFLFFPIHLFSQEKTEYEEISVTFVVEGIGSTEISALIHLQDVYLPIISVFDFLKVKNSISSEMESVTGYFITPDATFTIDRIQKQILYQNKTYNLKPEDLIRTETNLYLKSNYFGEIFGLGCNFNFRSLSVVLNTKIELPAIREMRLDQIRKNINRINGEIKADTVINRDYPLLQFGMLDWQLNSTQLLQGGTNTRYNLSLGGVLAGGEMKLMVNSYLNSPLSGKQIFYSWRIANNNSQLLRQVLAGKINSQAVSTIYAPIVGVQFTNTPTSYRRSFGFYTISDYTEPGWMVELYVNNVLVDYIKADPSGFFSFEAPLIYGNTEFMLRFYGQWGEERTSVRNISIPYNFLPPQEFEYTTSTGIVEDDNNTFFSRTSFNYGINRSITVGGGIEYLSSITSGKMMPFLRTSLSLVSNLLFSGEYIHGVKFKGILSYNLPSQIQFELIYNKYNENQKAINVINLEERNAVISFPIHLGNFMMFSRLNVNQTILPKLKFTTADFLLSAYIFGIGANLTTNAFFVPSDDPVIRSSLSLSFSLPSRFIIRPNLQYDYNLNKINVIKCELEKQIFGSLFLNSIFEKNFQYNLINIQFGMRYELPFAQTSSSASFSNNTTLLSQSASGSFMYDAATNYFAANNRTSVTKCGIVILPFLDINGNGKREPNEPRVSGLNVRLFNGGRIEYSERDTTTRIFDLEPYTNYFVELGTNRFENVAWQIKKSVLNISINPNQFKLVEVPIVVVGEASGNVYIMDKNGKKGQGRITVCFYNSESNLVGRVLTEVDGYFNFLGLIPGSYTVRIDSNQLKTLQMTAAPIEIPFKISPSRDGDVIEGLDFILKTIQLENNHP